MHLIDVRNHPFYQVLFPQKQLGQVLAICLQILFNDRRQRHQNNLAICIFIALLIWILCSDRNKKQKTRDFLELTTNYGCARPVFFNPFCYGAPLKMFWWTQAPYIQTRSPPNCAHACKYPGLNKQGKVGYSRHFFAFSTTAALFQVQTNLEFVTQ